MDDHSLTIEEAMDMVRNGTHILLTWNGCYGGGPYLSNEGNELRKILKKEGFDANDGVVLMEVLRRLGPDKATGPYSSFVLGLIEPRYADYIEEHEYDGKEGRSLDRNRFIMDEVEQHLEVKGMLAKAEFEEIVRESRNMGIITVLGTECSNR